MAAEAEIIDLCSSEDEDENDEAPVVATNQRIPAEASLSQSPVDAQRPNLPFSSRPLNIVTNSEWQITANNITKPKSNGDNFSDRRLESERAAFDQPNYYQKITPNGRLSPTASELLREAVARGAKDLEPKVETTRDDLVQISMLKDHCFACHVPLCNPFQRDVERSCYALHSHPTLKVPVCVVCSDEIANLVLTQPEEDDDICGLCGATDDLKLFFCDKSECRSPRTSICEQCVQQANPALNLADLEASTEEWFCPCCKPTRVIEELQKYLDDLQEMQQSPRGSNESRIESLLEDLQLVESKKAECDHLLDDQDDYKLEIELELKRAVSSGEELQKKVQEEFKMWLEAQHNHEARLADMITIIHEGLEREGVDLKLHYQKESQVTVTHKNEEWKIQADRALAKREQEERLKKPPPPPPPPTRDAKISEEELALEEVDDLGDTPEAPAEETVNTWRHAPYRAQDWQIEEAMKAEKQAFAASQRVPRDLSEKHDAKATLSEYKKSAFVRKDASIVVEQCQRNHRRAHQKRRSTDSSDRKPNASGSTSSSRGRTNTDTVRTHGTKKSTSHKKTTGFMDSDSSEKDDTLQQKKTGFGHLFENSDLVLTTDPDQRSIQVAEALCKILKPHQKDGIRFMFQNTFQDIAFPKDKLTDEIQNQVGGCILAHNMGLGKSLCCVALLHTLFFHPSLQDDLGQPFIRFAIMVAPVNTIRNWENEFSKWTEELGTHIDVHCVSSGGYHRQVIQTWAKIGGVLLISDALFRSKSKDFKEELHNRCDVIFLDEAHTMLKNKGNAGFKALMEVQTQRRICLTGSPFQNNLLEYFRMASYIRPGILGKSERSFEEQYVKPIVEGLSSDATAESKKKSDEAMNEIQAILQPYVDRKDASVLLKELPPMQQVVLHTCQTKVQRALNRAYKRFQQSRDDKDANNFLHMYSALRTIHNHPGTLLFRENKKKPKEMKSSLPKSKDSKFAGRDKETALKINMLETPKVLIKAEPLEKAPQQVPMAEKKDPDNVSIIELLSDSEEEASEPEKEVGSESEPTKELWWSSVAKKMGKEEMKKVENGNKVVLLLHILTHAQQLNEKVVLFAQCLKTLDYISSVLAIKDWASQVPSLADAFPGVSIGGWESGKNFLRIDGTTSASDRGSRINKFEDNSMRLFLISSRAGGIGINLCSANRVVLFDSHFNPTVDLQALYRCYRYGQQRGVFAYRFLTEGTTEAKVYKKAVNKSSLALSLVDGKSFQRLFTARETEDFAKTDSWAWCERCGKWRMFPPNENIDMGTLPDKWYCEMMNYVDKSMEIDCDTPERDELWYWNHFGGSNETKEKKNTSGPIVAMSGSAKSLSDDQKEKLVARDEILKGLLKVSVGKKSTKVVSRYFFHDALIDQDKDDKTGLDLEDQNAQPIDQGDATNGVEPSDQAGAKKPKVGSEVQSPQRLPQDTTRSEQSDRNKLTTIPPQQTNKAKEQQLLVVNSNKKRPRPQSSGSSKPKRVRRKIDFKSLWSGFD